MTSARKIRMASAVAIAVAGIMIVALRPVISSAQTTPTHIEVFNAEGPFEKDLDVGRAGFPTAGDFAVESQPLLDPGIGSALGRSLSELTIVRPVSRGQDLEVILHSTLRLPQGDVVLDGGLRFSELFDGGTIAVVGGTGSFAGARGTAAFTAGTVGGHDGFLISIDITTG